MPTQKRLCPTPGCPNLITRRERRCPTCAELYEQQRGTPAERTYDAQHQADGRRAKARALAQRALCPRCREPMLPGQALQFGHSKDRSRNSGARADRVEHAHCNQSAGGRLAHGLGPKERPPVTEQQTAQAAQTKLTPTIGRIVHYRLSESDADQINKRRKDARAYFAAHGRGAAPGEPGATGHVAHVGNDVSAGEVFPATIVKVGSSGWTNLQVALDGTDTYWATSRSEGDQDGLWSWPARG